MKGLEVKEVFFSELIEDNEKFRIDDEFFLKEYIAAYKKIKTKPYDKLGLEIDVLTDYHANGSYENLNKNVRIMDYPEYAYMIRSTDLEKLDFTSDVKYVDEHAYNHLNKTKLYGGELLINKIGSPGRTYLMPLLDRPATVGMNLFMIRLKKDTHYNCKFIWAFFNCKFGKKIIYRKVNGTVPLTIDKEAVRSLYLPRLLPDFQNKISAIIDEAFEKLALSKRIYSQAEEILLDEIGLKDFSPSTEPVNIKKFSESFATSGRLDAEYYQRKYEEVIAKIKAQSHDTLVNLVTISKSIEAGSENYVDEGLPFLRVADYSKYGTSEPQKCLSSNFVKANQKLIDKLKPKKGTIFFSKDGSVGTAYHLRADMDCITSGAILHLKVKDESQLIPEYLTLALNSKLVQMQSERDAGGSIILHWRVSEIENVIVPVIPYPKQQQIAELIEQSFMLKKQSEKLLEVAKRAVEIAIEQDEETALQYIKGNG